MKIDMQVLNNRYDFICNFNIFLSNKFRKYFKSSILFKSINSFARVAYDSFISFRCREIVNGFGFPNRLILFIDTKLKQHSGFKGYFYNKSNNSYVGMHLGVDFIQNNGFYYPVDINLDAAIRRKRRLLYDTEFDPIFLNLINLCKEKKIKKVVCFAEWWTELYISEVERLNNQSSVKFFLASHNLHADSTVQCKYSYSDNLDSDTLCVIFNHLPTPLDYFMTNQSCTSYWLKDECNRAKSTYIKFVDSSDRLEKLTLSFDDASPNLVIKLGGGSSGRHVKIVRAGKDFINKFINNEKQVYDIFNLDIISRFKNFIGQHNKVVFQKFILPEMVNGHAHIIRAHVLVAPGLSTLLSCHRVVSDFKAPDSVPLGVVKDDKPFVVNYSKGARYEYVSTKDELIICKATEELCDLINSAISKKFFITDVD